MSSIITPTSIDVVLGAGGTCNRMRETYKRYVDAYWEGYVAIPQKHSAKKREYIRKNVIEPVEASGGRFLRRKKSQNGAKGEEVEWFQLDPAQLEDSNEIIKAVANAFRDRWKRCKEEKSDLFWQGSPIVNVQEDDFEPIPLTGTSCDENHFNGFCLEMTYLSALDDPKGTEQHNALGNGFDASCNNFTNSSVS